MEFLDGKLLGVCGYIVNASDTYGFLPFYWNKSSQNLVLKSIRKRLFLKFNALTSLLLFAVQFYQIFSKRKQSDTLVFSFSMAPLCANFICLPCCFIVNFRTELITQYIEALCRFERHFGTKILKPRYLQANSVKGKLVTNLSKLLAHTPHIVILLVCNAFVNPCFPGHVGYLLVPSCTLQLGFLKANNFGNIEEIFGRLVVVAMYLLAWEILSAAALLLICLGSVFGFSMVSYTKSFYMLAYIYQLTKIIITSVKIYF